MVGRVKFPHYHSSSSSSSSKTIFIQGFNSFQLQKLVSHETLIITLNTNEKIQYTIKNTIKDMNCITMHKDQHVH